MPDLQGGHHRVSLQRLHIEAAVRNGNGNPVVTETQCGAKGGSMDEQILKAKREEMWLKAVAQVRQFLQNGAAAAGILADGNDPDYGGTTYPPIGDAGILDTYTNCFFPDSIAPMERNAKNLHEALTPETNEDKEKK
jgi:hypothetical protein